MSEDDELLSVFDLSEKNEKLKRLMEFADDESESSELRTNKSSTSTFTLSTLKRTIFSSNHPNNNSLPHSALNQSHCTLKMNDEHFLFPQRMLFRVTDSHSAQGIIKEPCFSSCNNLICSPYYRG
jgi:hypothetical protein